MRSGYWAVALGAALICGTGTVPLVSAADQSPVLAQDLNALVVPGKVSAVLWTRRGDSSTLQLVLPRQTQAATRAGPTPQQNPFASVKYPEILVWLLKSDGTQIPPTLRWQTPAGTCIRCTATEVMYSYPLSASTDAVAAVVSVDGEYHVERLIPFVD